MGVLNLKKYLVFLFIGFLVISSIGSYAIKIEKNTQENNDKILIFELPNRYSDKKIGYVNYVDNKISESANIVKPTVFDGFNYVIITIDDLINTIQSSSFIDWKTNIGHNIKIVSITDSEISNQPGSDLSAKIRNFLREYYPIWGIEYILIVADHETIPMRYCYPDSSNHKNTAGTVGGPGGDVPTDYYYADLSSSDEDSWDSDGDGYYGEYGDDNPDFNSEVFVGRIPIINPSRVSYTLEKTVALEQDTGDWKNSALHGGAFWYFTNENSPGSKAYDGATCMNEIEVNLMNGWTISHYSEQEGLEKSVFNWPALNKKDFADDWRTDAFSIVNEGAHGWSDGAYNKIWSYDDGDGKPEGNEITWKPFIHLSSNLDDDHPAVVYCISCVINYPEKNPSGQIGVDLLTDPSFGGAVGVVASTRSPWGTSDWPNNPGGAESFCYEFNRFMIKDYEPVGAALFKSMYFCHVNYGWTSWQEYNNLYCFNLYGDPSLVREGIETDTPTAPKITGPTKGATGETYDFNFMSIDPTNDQLYYYVEWGDGEVIEWSGPYNSGEQIVFTYSYQDKGDYTVRAKAKDDDGFESAWSSLIISMPKTRNIFYSGSFQAEIGLRNNEEPIVFLDGNYRNIRRVKIINGVATDNNQRQFRFQGIQHGRYLLLQIPIQGRIINIFSRISIDNNNNEFTGQWKTRGINRLSGWIEGSFS